MRAARALRKIPDFERFMSKIDKGAAGGCWHWNGGCDSNGYGVFWLNGKQPKANRQAWLYLKGAIPDGLFVLHDCDNKTCVNPDHLYVGTHEDNMRDAHERDRFARGAQVRKFVMFPGMIDRICDLRKAGYTIANLCKHLQIDRSTYFEWQKGER